jgi:hypothetical protein
MVQGLLPFVPQFITSEEHRHPDFVDQVVFAKFDGSTVTIRYRPDKDAECSWIVDDDGDGLADRSFQFLNEATDYVILECL